ncbi:MAG: helix-turn-helix domain-containing protein, partial [Oscillibacter sp.]|nr:helix-turn-helix domain-containing protein [Oscillibacter sp.]
MNTIATGTLIAQARKERNLTQGDLAAALHVSVQAVSKWERGLNFPDITLLEPLGELLGLTVAELMAGERDTPPQEALLQDSLRLGAAQSGRAKKWRRLFIGAAGVLLALVLGFGYLWVRDHNEWLHQKNTFIDPVEIGEMDSMVARVAGIYTLAAFDLTLS